MTDQAVAAAPKDPTADFAAQTDPDAFRRAPAREATLGAPGNERVVNLDAERAKADDKTSNYETNAQTDHHNRMRYHNEQYRDVKQGYSETMDGVRGGTDQSIGGAMWGRVTRMMNIDEGDVKALQQAHPEAWSSPGAALDYYGANPDKFQEVTVRPFVDGDGLGPSPDNRNAAHHPTPMPAKDMTMPDRDVMIRTVLGEAAGEGMEGQAAVALVIRNRTDDERFPDTVGGVSLQPRQFSAWNGDGSGNRLISKYQPGDEAYDRAAYVVDAVMGGYVPDFTDGATHYYSPAGMKALIDQGYQRNMIPSWLQTETANRDTLPVRIGGHVFTGQVKEGD